MALSEALIGVSGVVLGTSLHYLLARVTNKSIPKIALAKLSESDEVPDIALRTEVGFPPRLAQKYNNHPSSPGKIDAGQSLPINKYTEQLDKIIDGLKVNLGQIEHFNSVLSELFECLARKNQLEFIKILAEHNGVINGYLMGRISRYQTPPHIPDAIIPLAEMNPKDLIHVSRDHDNDYIVEIEGEAAVFGLAWTQIKSPDKRDIAERVSSELARAIGCFDVDILTEMLSALSSDVEKDIADLNKLTESVRFEKEKFTFVTASLVVSNNGKKPFHLDTQARLFVNSQGYSFLNEESIEVEVSKNHSIDLVCDNTHGVIEVPAFSTKTITYFSTEPTTKQMEGEALRVLSRLGERDCYVALKAYGVTDSPCTIYSEESIFRTHTKNFDFPENVGHKPNKAIQPTS